MAISDALIKRINELANKSKTEGLTEVEKIEQKELRYAYIQAFRGNLASQLDTIVVMDEKGNRSKLERKSTDVDWLDQVDFKVTKFPS